MMGTWIVVTTCIGIMYIMTLHELTTLQYSDCGSKFEISIVKYRECRGLFCTLTQEGEQKVSIIFRTNSYPFISRELFHNITWYHNNVTNQLKIHRVVCDGAKECSMAPRNGTHFVSAEITIPHEITHYGVFGWEAWNADTDKVLCIEANFFDQQEVKNRAIFHL